MVTEDTTPRIEQIHVQLSAIVREQVVPLVQELEKLTSEAENERQEHRYDQLDEQRRQLAQKWAREAARGDERRKLLENVKQCMDEAIQRRRDGGDSNT